VFNYAVTEADIMSKRKKKLISGSHGGKYEHGWLSSGSLRRVVWLKFTDVSEVIAASIIFLWNRTVFAKPNAFSSVPTVHPRHTPFCQTHDGTPQEFRLTKRGYETIHGHKYVSTYKSFPKKECRHMKTKHNTCSIKLSMMN
jgi:hypothetical protein